MEFHKKQRFSLRKFKVGVVSVFLGTTIFGVLPPAVLPFTDGLVPVVHAQGRQEDEIKYIWTRLEETREYDKSIEMKVELFDVGDRRKMKVRVVFNPDGEAWQRPFHYVTVPNGVEAPDIIRFKEVERRTGEGRIGLEDAAQRAGVNVNIPTFANARVWVSANSSSRHVAESNGQTFGGNYGTWAKRWDDVLDWQMNDKNAGTPAEKAKKDAIKANSAMMLTSQAATGHQTYYMEYEAFLKDKNDPNLDLSLAVGLKSRQGSGNYARTTLFPNATLEYFVKKHNETNPNKITLNGVYSESTNFRNDYNVTWKVPTVKERSTDSGFSWIPGKEGSSLVYRYNMYDPTPINSNDLLLDLTATPKQAGTFRTLVGNEKVKAENSQDGFDKDGNTYKLKNRTTNIMDVVNSENKWGNQPVWENNADTSTLTDNIHITSFGTDKFSNNAYGEAVLNPSANGNQLVRGSFKKFQIYGETVSLAALDSLDANSSNNSKPVNLFTVAEKPKDAVLYAPEAAVVNNGSNAADLPNVDAAKVTAPDQAFLRNLIKNGDFPVAPGLQNVPTKNRDDNGIRYSWGDNAPRLTETNGETAPLVQRVDVKVTYADGSSDMVPVDVRVNNDNNNSKPDVLGDTTAADNLLGEAKAKKSGAETLISSNGDVVTPSEKTAADRLIKEYNDKKTDLKTAINALKDSDKKDALVTEYNNLTILTSPAVNDANSNGTLDTTDEANVQTKINEAKTALQLYNQLKDQTRGIINHSKKDELDRNKKSADDKRDAAIAAANALTAQSGSTPRATELKNSADGIGRTGDAVTVTDANNNGKLDTTDVQEAETALTVATNAKTAYTNKLAELVTNNNNAVSPADRAALETLKNTFDTKKSEAEAKVNALRKKGGGSKPTDLPQFTAKQAEYNGLGTLTLPEINDHNGNGKADTDDVTAATNALQTAAEKKRNYDNECKKLVTDNNNIVSPADLTKLTDLKTAYDRAKADAKTAVDALKKAANGGDGSRNLNELTVKENDYRALDTITLPAVNDKNGNGKLDREDESDATRAINDAKDAKTAYDNKLKELVTDNNGSVSQADLTALTPLKTAYEEKKQAAKTAVDALRQAANGGAGSADLPAYTAQNTEYGKLTDITLPAINDTNSNGKKDDDDKREAEDAIAAAQRAKTAYDDKLVELVTNDKGTVSESDLTELTNLKNAYDRAKATVARELADTDNLPEKATYQADYDGLKEITLPTINDGNNNHELDSVDEAAVTDKINDAKAKLKDYEDAKKAAEAGGITPAELADLRTKRQAAVAAKSAAKSAAKGLETETAGTQNAPKLSAAANDIAEPSDLPTSNDVNGNGVEDTADVTNATTALTAATNAKKAYDDKLKELVTDNNGSVSQADLDDLTPLKTAYEEKKQAAQTAVDALRKAANGGDVASDLPEYTAKNNELTALPTIILPDLNDADNNGKPDTAGDTNDATSKVAAAESAATKADKLKNDAIADGVVTEAEKQAIEQANEDVNEAKAAAVAAVTALPDSDAKDALQGRVEKVVPATVPAVTDANNNGKPDTAGDTNDATSKVAAAESAATKADKLKNDAMADGVVTEAEKQAIEQANEDVNEAKAVATAAVNALPDSDKKDELLTKLDEVSSVVVPAVTETTGIEKDPVKELAETKASAVTVIEAALADKLQLIDRSGATEEEKAVAKLTAEEAARTAVEAIEQAPTIATVAQAEIAGLQAIVDVPVPKDTLKALTIAQNDALTAIEAALASKKEAIVASEASAEAKAAVIAEAEKVAEAAKTKVMATTTVVTATAEGLAGVLAIESVSLPTDPSLEATPLVKAQKAAVEAINLALDAKIIAIHAVEGTTDTDKAMAIVTAYQVAQAEKAKVVATTTEEAAVKAEKAGVAAVNAVSLPVVGKADSQPVIVDQPILEVAEKAIAVEVIRRSNPNLAKGQEVVVQSGVAGLQKVYEAVTYNADGQEIARTIVATEVLKEMIPQIIEVGTKEGSNMTTASEMTELNDAKAKADKAIDEALTAKKAEIEQSNASAEAKELAKYQADKAASQAKAKIAQATNATEIATAVSTTVATIQGLNATTSGTVSHPVVSSTPTVAKTVHAAKGTPKSLPNTGEENAALGTIFGTGMLVATLALVKKRKQEEQ